MIVAMSEPKLNRKIIRSLELAVFSCCLLGSCCAVNSDRSATHTHHSATSQRSAAEWRSLAEAVERYQLLVVQMLERWPDAELDLVEAVGRERKLLRSSIAEFSGAADVSAPRFLFLWTDAFLKLANLPLSEDQRQAGLAIAEDFDRALALRRAGYAESTTPLQALVDDLELKQRASREQRQLLSEQQMRLVAPIGTEDRAGFDFLSPVSFVPLVRPMIRTTEIEEIREAFFDYLGFEGSEAERGESAQSEALELALESWRQQVLRLISRPLASGDPARIYPHLDDVMLAARATLGLQRALREGRAISTPLRRKLLEAESVFFPRRVESD